MARPRSIFRHMDLERKRQRFIEHAERAASKAIRMRNRDLQFKIQKIATLYQQLARQTEELAEIRNELGRLEDKTPVALASEA